MSRRQGLKLALCLYCLLLALVFWQLRRSAAQGYELSIYGPTPLLTWVVVFGGMLAGVALIAYQALTGKGGRTWLVGLGLIMVSNFILSALPALRGYYLYNLVDPPSHLSYTSDIIDTGKLSRNNYYPLTHLLIAPLSETGGVDLRLVAGYLPAFFVLFYMANVYLLASLVLPRPPERLLAAAATATPLFGLLNVSLYSQGASLLAFPLVLYLYFRKREARSLGYVVPFLVLVLSYPFYHPYDALRLSLMLGLMEVAFFIYHRVRPQGSVLPAVSVGVAFLVFVPLFLWFSSFPIFAARIDLAWEVITGSARENPQLVAAWGAFHMSLWDRVQYFLRMYGYLLVYGPLALIGAVLIANGLRRGKAGLGHGAVLLTWVVASQALTLVSFAAFRFMTVGRAIYTDFGLALSPLFVGLGLYYLLGKLRAGVGWKVAATSVILAGAAALSAFSLYRGPYTMQPNLHLTYEEVQATRWLIDHKPERLQFNGLGYVQAPFEVVLGQDGFLDRRDLLESGIRLNHYNLYDILPHLGYGSYHSAEQYLTIEGAVSVSGYAPRISARYLAVSERFWAVREYPPFDRARMISNPLFGRWDITREDLQRLERDASVIRIYTSGGVEFYLLVPFALYDGDPFCAPRCSPGAAAAPGSSSPQAKATPRAEEAG